MKTFKGTAETIPEWEIEFEEYWKETRNGTQVDYQDFKEFILNQIKLAEKQGYEKGLSIHGVQNITFEMAEDARKEAERIGYEAGSRSQKDFKRKEIALLMEENEINKLK